MFYWIETTDEGKKRFLNGPFLPAGADAMTEEDWRAEIAAILAAAAPPS